MTYIRPNYTTPNVTLSISPKSKSCYTGDTFTLAAAVTPARMKLTWSSSDTSIAKVTSSGTVTAVNPGTATITVKSATGKTATCALTVKARSGVLLIEGMLDGEFTNGLDGYGTADIYINGNLDSAACTSYEKSWPAGTSYEIKNLTALDGKNYDGLFTGELTGTIGNDKVTRVTPMFTSDGTASVEWQYGRFVPGNLDRSTLDIEYNHFYETDAVNSPGAGWVKGDLISSRWVNDGQPVSTYRQQATSDNYILLKYFYFHYCTGSDTANANYASTSKYVHYDAISDPNSVTVAGTYTDKVDSSIKYYALKWKNGNWARCKSGTTCDGSSGSHGERSYYWYRMNVYQARHKEDFYHWTRTTGWVSNWDKSANSFNVRYRLKDGIELSEDMITDIIVPDEICLRTGESVALDVGVVPAGIDPSVLSYRIDNPNVAQFDSEGRITAKYDNQLSSTTLTISASNGVSKTVAIHVTHNILSESFHLNGQLPTGQYALDVYDLGQTVAYTYDYELINTYDPGYNVVIKKSDGSALVQDQTSHTVSFDDSGILNIVVETPVSQIPFGNVLVIDEQSTVHLPRNLEALEDEAFSGTEARYFYTPNTLKSIGKNAFPRDSVVFLNTSALEFCDADDGTVLYVETGDTFNSDFASEHEGRYRVSRGIDIPIQYSKWSEWSSTPIVANNHTEVESKMQYRTAAITQKQELGAWSAWSSWSNTRQNTVANLKEEESRTLYQYYFFKCSNCGAQMPYSTKCLTELGGCGKSGVSFTWNQGVWLTTPKSQCTKYDSIKYWTTYNGKKVYYYSDADTVSMVQYRYRTREYVNVEVIGDYTVWMDGYTEASDSLIVETRQMYRYRTKFY